MYNLKIYDSLKSKKVSFEPIDRKNIKVYACGPTVYDYAHIGNARMAVVFDTLIRLLKKQYSKVTYVSNITDIDDKIIERSILEKIPIKTITDKYTKIYNEDMKMLNVLLPDYQPRATEYVKEMIKSIKVLIKKNYAYIAEKHVLFNVSSFPKYGTLSSRNREQQIAGSRVKVAKYKKNSGDCVLWKPSKENEPSWESPWGMGRPGWHTECFVMSKEILGIPFDIHGGGLDLKFPHHENELAQCCCFYDEITNENSYAKYWMHNGFVTINSEKMSKSLGNIKLIKDYLKFYDGEVIRLALLSSHYRSPLNWTEKVLEQSKSILQKYYKILNELRDLELVGKSPNFFSQEIMNALLDDLNIPKAINILDNNVKNITIKNLNEKKLIKKAILDVGKILGIFLKSSETFDNKNIDSNTLNQINNLINYRNEARKNKDYQLADEIRKKLYNMGIEINDESNKTHWKKI